MKGQMDRFRMVQLQPDNARLELFDGDKSLGYFWTPKMAKLEIEKILKNEPVKPDMSFKVHPAMVEPVKVEPKPVFQQRGRPRK